MKWFVTAVTMVVILCDFAVAIAYGQPNPIRTFKIGFVADQAPFSDKVEGKSPQGYGIDLCRRIAAEVNNSDEPTPEYVGTNLNDAFRSISEGRIDLLCGAITITLGRRRFVDFSQPIFRTGAGALLRIDSPRDLRDLFLGERTISPPRSPQMRAFATSLIGVRTGSTTAPRAARSFTTASRSGRS